MKTTYIDGSSCCNCGQPVGAGQSGHTWEYVVCDVVNLGSHWEQSGNYSSRVTRCRFQNPLPQPLRVALCMPCLLRMTKKEYIERTAAIAAVVFGLSTVVAVLVTAEGKALTDASIVAICLCAVLTLCLVAALWSRARKNYLRIRMAGRFRNDGEARKLGGCSELLTEVAVRQAKALDRITAVPLEEWNRLERP